jgi:L-threonylcarbamoyladenylate synthase
VTELIGIDRVRPNPSAIAKAVDCLRRGGLVAFPTETVYGLGVHALEPPAVRRLFEAKGRPPNDPLIVHLARFDEVHRLVSEIPPAAVALADRFWPGPLTLVMRRSASVPAEVTAGLDTVAIRIPSHPVAHALLSASGLPVAAPSANLFSRPSPTRASHVLEDLDGRIDMVLDAGPTDVGVESTVLDLTSVPPTVLRPGAVGIETLREVIPDILVRSTVVQDDRSSMASPGLLAQHYAPRTPMTLYAHGPAATADRVVRDVRDAIAAGRRVGVLATTEDAAMFRALPVVIAELGSEVDPQAIAARLYGALRELDSAGLDLIIARDFAVERGLWRALRDRLRRASARYAGT